MSSKQDLVITKRVHPISRIFQRIFKNGTSKPPSPLLKPISTNALILDPSKLSFDDLRSEIIGIDSMFVSPFGKRLITYADYTASGRSLKFIEDYIRCSILPSYGNTHTEDVYTGSFMTNTLAEAETLIKSSVKAGANGKIIAFGNGSTGAINKLQELVGVFIPPATRLMYEKQLKQFFGEEQYQSFEQFQKFVRPIVFVGPYEHHSNEISWRQGIATVVEVKLDMEGKIDLNHLKELLEKEEYKDRLRLGSFSAASNVTGMRSDVKAIAKLLHSHDCYACFDFAASAPYVDIDMSGEDGSHIDAIFISPHKFLGGPGSSGILIFNEKLYHKELPPSFAGGGTVQYVNDHDQDFVTDTEERERAGTPGAIQTLRAALGMQLKNSLGIERIEQRERQFLEMAFAKWTKNEKIVILGSKDPCARISIVSFNIINSVGKWLHPKLVAKLLNDLFGVQSRAGCSCAGPYGHKLLSIDENQSNTLRNYIKDGYHGLKLGWCRVGLHYAMDEAEVEFIINCVLFLADYGHLFVPLYDFDVPKGTWTFREEGHAIETPSFGINQALAYRNSIANVFVKGPLDVKERMELYDSYFKQAKAYVKETEKSIDNFQKGPKRENSQAFDPLVFASAWFQV